MISIRPAASIHTEEGGWFSARWHFSFGGYHDPEWMGIGPLRVLNDDRLIPGATWPLHPHRDIEGITYVVEGTFRHEDSAGNGGVLRAGAIQRATLGSGMWHSEQNGSETEPLRFLQLWILPDTPDLEPSVEQREYTQADRTNRLLHVLGPVDAQAAGDLVSVHQDANVYIARLEAGVEAVHPAAPDRAAYVYLLVGSASLGEIELAAGDAAVVRDEPAVLKGGAEPGELIVIDVPLAWTPVGVWAA